MQAPIFVHPARENCDLKIEFFLRNKSFGTISTIFIGSFELKKPNENTFKSSNRIQTYLNEIRLFTSRNDNGSPKKLVIKGLQTHFVRVLSGYLDSL